MPLKCKIEVQAGDEKDKPIPALGREWEYVEGDEDNPYVDLAGEAINYAMNLQVHQHSVPWVKLEFTWNMRRDGK